MNFMLGLTQGTALFFAGIGVLVFGILFAVISACTAKGRKRRIEARMKEKY